MSIASVLKVRRMAASEGNWVFTESSERARTVQDREWVEFIDEHSSTTPKNVVAMKLRARSRSTLSEGDPDLLSGSSGGDSDPITADDIVAAIIAEVED